MNKVAVVMGAVLGFAAMGAQAGVLDLSLGNNSFRADYNDALSNVLPGTSKGEYDVGAIAKPRNEDEFYQVHAGLLLTGDVGTQGVNIAAGLGGRLLYVNKDHENGGGLALGGKVEARLPQYNRFGLSASSYYAPSVVTVGRLDNSWENNIDLDYELIRGGNVYVGYRNLRQEIAHQDMTNDNGFHLGFRLKF